MSLGVCLCRFLLNIVCRLKHNPPTKHDTPPTQKTLNNFIWFSLLGFHVSFGVMGVILLLFVLYMLLFCWGVVYTSCLLLLYMRHSFVMSSCVVCVVSSLYVFKPHPTT